MIAALALAPLVATSADAPVRKKQAVVVKAVTDRIYPAVSQNIITYSAPRAVPLRELGLDKLNLPAHRIATMSTEIRIYASRTATNSAPKRRLYLNADEGGQWWYFTGGKGSAEAHVIQPGELVVLINRGATNEIPWKNPLAE